MRWVLLVNPIILGARPVRRRCIIGITGKIRADSALFSTTQQEPASEFEATKRLPASVVLAGAAGRCGRPVWRVCPIRLRCCCRFRLEATSAKTHRFDSPKAAADRVSNSADGHVDAAGAIARAAGDAVCISRSITTGICGFWLCGRARIVGSSLGGCFSRSAGADVRPGGARRGIISRPSVRFRWASTCTRRPLRLSTGITSVYWDVHTTATISGSSFRASRRPLGSKEFWPEVFGGTRVFSRPAPNSNCISINRSIATYSPIRPSGGLTWPTGRSIRWRFLSFT